MELLMELPTAKAPYPTGPTTGSSPSCALKRPKTDDEAVVVAAARAIASLCLIWDPAGAIDQWEQSVFHCRSDWGDGYRFARALDRGHLVDPDAELVQILDGASSLVFEEHDAAVRQWVGVVGFDPTFAVGDVVETDRHGSGPIRSIDYGLARYVVDVKGTGTGGVIVDAESVVRADVQT